MSDPSIEPARCKYCLHPADEQEGGSFVKPCGCHAPVHQRCLFQWICDQQGKACEACREPWRGLMQVTTASLLDALGQAQQGQQGQKMPADTPDGTPQQLGPVLHTLMEDVGAGMLRRGALVERQLLRALAALKEERQARQEAAALVGQLRLELGLALRGAAGTRAALRAAEEVVQSVPNAAAVQAAYRRAEQAEAEWSDALDSRDRYKTEAEAARRDKGEAQAELNQERYRADQLELQVISLQEDVRRLRAVLGRQGGEQAQQAQQAQQGEPTYRPQQDGQLVAENRQLQGDVLRLLGMLEQIGREQQAQLAQHAQRHQAVADQQAAEQLRLREEVRQLQAHIRQLEPEAELMRSIRQQAQQAQQARGSIQAQQNGGKQAHQSGDKQMRHEGGKSEQAQQAEQAQQGAGRQRKTREEYMRRCQRGADGRRSGASSAQLIGQLPQQWAVVAVGALGMAICALTGKFALTRLGKLGEQQQAH